MLDEFRYLASAAFELLDDITIGSTLAHSLKGLLTCGSSWPIKSSRTMTTQLPAGPKFFPELAYMTPYLLTSTGRDSKLDVMSATSTLFGPTSGSVWNVKPDIVSLPQMCTYAASSDKPLQIRILVLATAFSLPSHPRADTAMRCLGLKLLLLCCMKDYI